MSVVADRDEMVVLVDPRDAVVGVAPKLDAHRDGRLHRAVSVMLFDDFGRLLLQRRADSKYHSGGLWSNTCCGHPRPGESVNEAGLRRLSAELGIKDCELTGVGEFVYFALLDDGLVEHELDHVLIGRWNGHASPDPLEVAETRWIDREALRSDMNEKPAEYTAWLRWVVDHACGGEGAHAA
jgi:isopentenyl-diphosphate delta-isomerase